MTLVATHYPELKAYAQLTPGVRNACVEFDPETLRPTYRLTIGIPGRSNALAIARRLGLDEEIVRRAEALLSPQDRQTEHLLADLHRLRLEAARARDEAYAARAEAQRLTEELRRRLARIDEERAAILEEARREAQEELERLREEARAAAAVAPDATGIPRGAGFIRRPWPTPCRGRSGSRAGPAGGGGGRSPPGAGTSAPYRPASARGYRLGEVAAGPRGGAGPGGRRGGGPGGPPAGAGPARELERRAPPERPVEPSGVRYAPQRPPPAGPARPDGGGGAGEPGPLPGCGDAGRPPWAHIVHGKGISALRQAVRDFLRRHPWSAPTAPARRERAEMASPWSS